MGKFDIENTITSLDTEWNGRTGQEVEDFLCRKLENLDDKSIASLYYNTEDNQLLLLNDKGEIVAKGEVSVITPLYEYKLKIAGIEVNNVFYDYSNYDSIEFQYKSDVPVYARIGLYVTSQTSVTTDVIRSYKLSLSYGTKSLSGVSVTSLSKDKFTFGSDNNIDGFAVSYSELPKVDISSLFNESQTSKQLTINVIENSEIVAIDTLSYNITSRVIKLRYNSQYVVNSNNIQFSIDGGNSSDFYLSGYISNSAGNRKSFYTSGTLTYSDLKAGLNQIVVRGVRTGNDSIYTDYLTINVIYTQDCKETVVAINGVSDIIPNNDLATLYELSVYSPDKSQTEIKTYLDDEIEDEPTNIIKLEIITTSYYDDNNTYETSYSKYIEINSNNASKYLIVEVNGVRYNFLVVYNNSCYSQNYAELLIDAVDENLSYYSDVTPEFNFDQTSGYINEVFKTKEYYPSNYNISDSLNSTDGWTEENGRTIFRLSAQDNDVFTTPLNLGLNANNFSIELGFKTYNISDESKSILKIGDLELRPTQLCFGNVSGDTFDARNSQFEESVDTHILITYLRNYKLTKGEAYYPTYITDSSNLLTNTTINLMRIYINGTIDREIALDSSETFRGATLQITPQSSDIDFSLFRVYANITLNFDLVKRNYISYQSDKQSKQSIYDANDILKSDGEISFKKSYKKYNSLVYVYPTGGKFPNITWGDDVPNKKIPNTLFINYADTTKNNTYGGRLNYLLTKGQGSSAMKYSIWNNGSQTGKFSNDSTFVPYSNLLENNTFKTEPENVLTNYYLMPTYDGQVDTTAYKVKKLCGKVNFASSMQSHKIGACKLYDDGYKKLVNSSLGCRTAVLEEPFFYFYWETDLSQEEVANMDLATVLENDDNVKFMGFQTWGSAKGDKATFGLSDEVLMVEGGENTDVSANFRCPWQELQRYDSDSLSLLNAPQVSYTDSLEHPEYNLKIYDESIYHTTRGSWDIDSGLNDAGDGINESALDKLKIFRAFYDFNYLYDTSMKFVSSSSELDTSSWDTEYKYCVLANTFSVSSHEKGCIYRYDTINNAWVHAGANYVNGAWQPIKIYTLLGISTTTSTVSYLSQSLKEKYYNLAPSYYDVDDCAYHQANIKFNSGTDNRAKNTYYKITDKVRMVQDDLDTINKTDNNGKQTKSYNILEPSFKYKLQGLVDDSKLSEMFDGWGDSNNIFFKSLDVCFEDKIKSYLQGLINLAFTDLSVSNTSNYYYKTFFSVQSGFPSVAFNHTAKIYYENAQIIKNTSGVLDSYSNNNVEPIEQSHGSCLPCEKQFMKNRLIFLSSYAKQSPTNRLVTSSSGGSGDVLNFKMEFEPYLEFYPLYEWDGIPEYMYENTNVETDSINSGNTTLNYDSVRRLAISGNKYTTSITKTAKSINLSIYYMNLYKSIDILGLTYANFSNVNFERATDFTIDNTKLSGDSLFGSSYPYLEITEFTPSFPVIENLTLRSVSLPNTLNLSECTKLRVLNLDNSQTKKVILPESDRLTTITLPETITNFSIYNNSGLLSVTLQGTSNLLEVYIDCAKCGSSFDVSKFCNEELINCNNLESVTLINANLNLTEEALLKLAYLPECTINGKITVIDSNSSITSISFATKKILVEKFGNIDSNTSKTYINYTSESISSFTYSQQVYLYYQGDLKVGDTVKISNPFNINASYGNNVKIKLIGDSYGLDISYSISPTNGVASINADTGDITFTNEDTKEYTVTIKLNTSSTTITNKATAIFSWIAPQIADFAYADGSFSSIYDESKTLVGIVYAKEETDSTSGKVYIFGTEHVNATYDSDGLYGGYTNEGVSNSTTTTLKNLYNVQTYLQNTVKVSDVDNYCKFDGLSTTIPMNDIIKTTYVLNYSSDGKFDNSNFTGKDDTLKYVNHVNDKLLSVMLNNSSLNSYIDSSTHSITSLKNLNLKMTQVANNNDGIELTKCILYPYYYSMYLYEPTVKSGETLDSQYSKNNWYAPNALQLGRVIYYRGLSAVNESSSSSDFTNAHQVAYSIDTTKTSSSTNEEDIPVFSLVQSRMGKANSVWTALVGSLNSSNYVTSNRNNMPTTVNYDDIVNNYSYQSYFNYTGSTYVYYMGWFPGKYDTSDWQYSSARTNASRLSKHLGIPFTEYNYSKS